MLRRVIPLLTGLFVAGSLSAAPVPKQPPPDDSVSPSAVRLLEHRKIQKELKMTAEQRIVIYDGLADIEEDYEKKIDQLVQNPNIPDEAFEKLDKDREKAIEKLLNDTATKGLTAAQRTRLRQLDCRLRGAVAFTDPQVEKKLQLTEEQKKKATEIAERMNGEVDRYFENLGNEDIAKQKANMFAFRKERLAEMEKLLTADQKMAWKNLLGEAPTGFDVDELWLRIEEGIDFLPIPGIGK
jgi:hypothetical protein